MDLLKNKPVLATIVAIVFIVLVVFVSKKMEGMDSLNNQLNPMVAETKKDFEYLYDKKTGMLMSGSDFQKDELEGRYVPLDATDIPIDVIAPDSFLLDDGDQGRTGLHTNMCSPQCCSSQYPTPHKMTHDKKLCNLQNFVPNNMTCQNSWNNSACLCLTKDQANNLYNRGGNA